MHLCRTARDFSVFSVVMIIMNSVNSVVLHNRRVQENHALTDVRELLYESPWR